MIINANLAACDFYGYSLEVLKSMNINDINQLSEDEVRKEMLLAKDKKKLYFNFRHKVASGEIKDVEVYTGPINVDEKQLLYSIIHDISSSKKAENELAENEKLLRQIAENYPNSYVSIIEKDFTCGFSSGQEFKKQNLDPNIFIGLSIDTIFGDKAEIVKNHYTKTFNGEEVEFELFINNQNQHYRLVPLFAEDGSIPRILAVVENISEKKIAEKALKESEERFRELVDTINSGVAVYKVINDGEFGKDYIIQDFNRAALELEGKKKKDVIGKSLFDLRPNIDEFGLISIFRKAWKTGTPAFYPAKVYVDEKFSNYYENRVFRLQSGEIVAIFDDVTEREHAAAKIEESRERYNLAMEATKDGLYDWNLITDYVYYSPGWKSMLGYKYDELPNDLSAWDKLADPEDVKKTWKMLRELFDKKRDRLEMEFKMKHKDGHWVDILSRAEAIFDEYGKAIRVVGTHVNISERKLAEKNLIKSEEKFRSLYENSPFGIIICQLLKNKDGEVIDFIHLEANHSTARHTGFDLNNFLGKKATEVSDTQQIQDLIHKYHQVILTKEPLNYSEYFEFYDRTLDVTVFPLYDDLFIINFIDISERKRAEEDLQKSEELRRVIIDSSNDCIKLLDNKGNLQFMSIGGQKLLQIDDIDPFLNESWIDFWKGEDNEKARNNIHKALAGETGYFEGFCPTNKGMPKWWGIIVSPIFNNNGKVDKILAVSRDITESRHIKENLIKAKERAEESDRLKSAFLANMSHEIRTPMNGILGFSELLRETEISGEERQEYLNVIENSGQRMLNIINDLISISKVEAGQMEINISETNINVQIENLYTFFKPEVEKKGMKLSFSNTLSKEEAIIETDKEKVYAILTNLIKNAIKYSKTGNIEFGYKLKNDGVTGELEFCVKDTWIGIPKNRQHAIFDRFVQADIEDKDAMEGAGLGLSICKAYVEMLEGKIWVESQLGAGSQFYFTIPYNPIQKEKPKFYDGSIKEKIESKIKGLKILIVEDEDFSNLFLSIILKNISKEILYANNGKKAVEICLNNPELDLILMDIKMPVLDGNIAMQKIREFNKDVKIIVQTAHAFKAEREKAFDSGCDDYITKPINKEELLKIIFRLFV